MSKSESNVTPELRRALAAVLRKTTAGFEEHPAPDRLFAFSAGELSGEDEEAVREHLSLCRDCIDRLALDPEDPVARERHGIVDFETERAWREMLAQIREHWAAKRLERERRRSRMYQIAAAACLVLAAGLGWKVGVTPTSTSPVAGSADVSGPTVNVGIYDVHRSTERSGSGQQLDPQPVQGGPEVTTLDVPEDSFTLVFVLESGDYDDYELRILDSERNELWTNRDVVVREDRATLSLSRTDLSAGHYYVQIICWRQDEAKVWEYPIHLTYS